MRKLILLFNVAITAYTAEHSPYSFLPPYTPQNLHMMSPDALESLIGDYDGEEQHFALEKKRKPHTCHPPAPPQKKHRAYYPNIQQQSFLQHQISKIAHSILHAHHYFDEVITRFKPEFNHIFTHAFPSSSWCNTLENALCSEALFFSNSTPYVRALKQFIILCHLTEQALNAPADKHDYPSWILKKSPTFEEVLAGLSKTSPKIAFALSLARHLNNTSLSILYVATPHIPLLAHIVAHTHKHKILPLPTSLMELPSFGYKHTPQSDHGCTFIFNIMLQQIYRYQMQEFAMEMHIPGTIHALNTHMLADIYNFWAYNGPLRIVLYTHKHQSLNISLKPKSPEDLSKKISSLTGKYNTHSMEELHPDLPAFHRQKGLKALSQHLHHLLEPMLTNNYHLATAKNRQLLNHWGIQLHAKEMCTIEHIRALIVAYLAETLPRCHPHFYKEFNRYLDAQYSQKPFTFILSAHIPFFIAPIQQGLVFCINIPHKGTIAAANDIEKFQLLNDLITLYCTHLCPHLTYTPYTNFQPHYVHKHISAILSEHATMHHSTY